MIKVVNNHECVLLAPPEQIAEMMASLASKEDRLWPKLWWPAMRFDRALSEGAVGGHGPIQYSIESYAPDEAIVFRFSAPRGFHGTHAYCIEPVDESRTRLRHVLEMRITGPALLTWPLVYRPLHDALIEDSLNVAKAQLQDKPPQHQDWSWYVRLLRRILAGRQRR